MKYQTKIQYVEATQWFPGVEHAAVCTQEHKFSSGPDESPQVPHLHLPNDSGFVLITPGVWLVTYADGETWLNDDKTFTATYEPVKP